MSDGFMLYLDDDGVARHYDDTYDITIHCESEEEQQKAIEQLKSLQWIPCSERLPKEYGNYLITTHNGDVDVGTIDPKKKGVWSACDADGFYWIREVVAWMPLPEPYKGG